MLINKFKIGFIGASKTGTVLARYLQMKGLHISGFYSNHSDALKETVKLIRCSSYSDINKLVAACNIIFITTNDSNIFNTWKKINSAFLLKKYIYHCSGALSSNVFESNENTLITGKGSLHPMASFYSKKMPLGFMNEVVFAIEGDKMGVNMLHQLLNFTKNRRLTLNKDKKTEYHIACVAMSNFFISLCGFAQNLLNNCLEENELPTNSINSLMCFPEAIIQKMSKGIDLKDILTGPLVRQDYTTLQQHMSHLKGNDKILYQALSYNLLNQFFEESAKHPDLLKTLEISENYVYPKEL